MASSDVRIDTKISILTIPDLSKIDSQIKISILYICQSFGVMYIINSDIKWKVTKLSGSFQNDRRLMGTTLPFHLGKFAMRQNCGTLRTVPDSAA